MHGKEKWEMNKTVAATILTVVLSSMLTSAFSIELSEAEETICIRSDGTIDPSTAPIQRDREIYTFTDNIFGEIFVEKDNIVVDGAGYTLQGNGDGRGVEIRWHGTVQNLQIINFNRGISAVANNTILGNYIADCDAGIWIIGGANNYIKNNTFANNINPISIAYSGGNHVITENSFINGTFIIVWMTPEPTVDRNYWSDYNGTDADGDGIGDIPYVYGGNQESKFMDYHPLMEPVPVIPEFPSWTPLLIMLLAIVAVALIYRRSLHTQTREGIK